MSSNKNDDEIFGISQKNIRQDILLFKEEVLKDIKIVQKEFSNKFSKMQDLLKDQINIYESKVNTFEQRIKNLSNLVSSDRSIIQKIEELIKFKEETKDKILTDSIRITNLESDYKVGIKNIEKILSSSVIYPGLIGYSGKFKSFHDYMDFVLNQISDLNSFKEKNILDLAPYKKKIDESLEFIKLQVNHIISSSNELTIKSVNDCEQRMKSLIQLYDDRLQDTRVENAHYSIGLEKRSEELSRLIKNMYDIKNDIYKKFKEEVSNVKGDQRTLVRLFTSYKKEFGVIKDKFIQLSEFIRDVRFRVNIAPDVQKKEFISMSKRLGLNNKDNSDRKYKSNRVETYELNKKYLNNNFELLDSSYNNYQKKYHSNTFNNLKRKSLQVTNSYKFTNKVISKFENSNNPKEETKNKKSSNNSSNKLISINKNITNFDNGENDFNNKSDKKNLMRRNTTISLSNKFNKDFSESNPKNFNNILNNDIFNSLKVDEEDSIYSSQSYSEDKSKSDRKDKEKNKNDPTNKKENIKKPQEIIKEEDENNMSEIVEDHNNNIKLIKENTVSKKEIITSKIINNKNSNVNNDKKKDEKTKDDNDKEQKQIKEENIKENKENETIKKKIEAANENINEKNKNDTNNNEKPLNKDNIEIKNSEKPINKDNIEIKNNEKPINKDNINTKNNEKPINKNNIDIKNNEKHINKDYLDIKNNEKRNAYKENEKKILNPKNKTFSAKLFIKKEKNIKLQVNQNELPEKLNKDNERNNTISIVNINEMFMNNDNKPNKRIQFINSPSNNYITLSVENNYLNQNVAYERNHSLKNKSNPSLISKSNKITIESTSLNNIDNITSKNNKINRRYFENFDTDGLNAFEKSGQAYKTFSNFPKLGLDGHNAKTKINTKVIQLDNKNNKNLSEIAQNFLNKKIKKINLNKDINFYSHSKKNFTSALLIPKQITKYNNIYKK